MDNSARRQAALPTNQIVEEMSRLSILQVQKDHNEIDRHVENLRIGHLRSLEDAQQQHGLVYADAISTLQAEELEHKLEEDRKRKEQEQRILALREKELSLAREHEKQLRERQRIVALREREVEDERRKREAEAKRLEEEEGKRRAEEEAAKKLAEQEAADEKAQAIEKAQAEAKAKQAAIDAIKQSATAPVSQPPGPLTSAPASEPVTNGSLPNLRDKEAAHERYLEIHQNLKKLRVFMKEQSKLPNMRNLKSTMNEGRRTIQKCISQLVEDNAKNKGPQEEIRKVLRSGLDFPQPQVTVTDYLFDPRSLEEASDPTGPGLLLYFFNVLAKQVMRQFLNEAATKPKAADPVGVQASTMFATSDLLWHGRSLIDILIAKFHYVCPVVFGIYGPESTQQGRLRLGWHREEGRFCTTQRHNERMTGLGAGFASIGLRNFDKSRLNNPFPPWRFWAGLANVLNVPSEQITETHMVLLKAMIEGSEQRILEFFGNAGRAALRMATIDYPARAPREVREGAAARGLSLLPDLWKRDMKFYV